jgi:hypothetical protein
MLPEPDCMKVLKALSDMDEERQNRAVTGYAALVKRLSLDCMRHQWFASLSLHQRIPG